MTKSFIDLLVWDVGSLVLVVKNRFSRHSLILSHLGLVIFYCGRIHTSPLIKVMAWLPKTARSHPPPPASPPPTFVFGIFTLSLVLTSLRSGCQRAAYRPVLSAQGRSYLYARTHVRT